MIYYFHDEAMPLLALRIYAKNDQVDLTAKDRKQMKAEVQEYVKSQEGKR